MIGCCYVADGGRRLAIVTWMSSVKHLNDILSMFHVCVDSIIAIFCRCVS